MSTLKLKMVTLRLERSLEQWAGGKASVIADGSKAQMMYFIEDAQKDIAALALHNEQLLDRAELAEATAQHFFEALQFYANPEIYRPHPDGPFFDRRDLSATAVSALASANTVLGGE